MFYLFLSLSLSLVPNNGRVKVEEIEGVKPLLQLVFYMVDKVKRFRLSREVCSDILFVIRFLLRFAFSSLIANKLVFHQGKMKADKNRLKVEEAFLKTTHVQRQEAAQQRREEKRRAEKEKILNEDDPEKQRKWEVSIPSFPLKTAACFAGTS